MWDLPGPGLEPVSPALAGGFLTTVPPGKSGKSLFVALYFVCNFGVRTTEDGGSFKNSYQGLYI